MKILSSLCLVASFSLMTITLASAGSATYKGKVAQQPARRGPDIDRVDLGRGFTE